MADTDKLVKVGQLDSVADAVIEVISDTNERLLNAFPADTASGAVASFTDGANGLPVKSLVVGIEPVQSGSGDPSPTNVRPISGWTGAAVNANGTPITIDFGQTIYGGALDVLSGVLTVDRAIVDLGTLTWVSENSAINGLARVNVSDVTPLGAKFQQTPICSTYKGVPVRSYSSFEYGEIAFSNSETQPMIRVRSQTLSGLSDSEIKTAMNGVQFVYELAAPMTYQLTPHEVSSLLGANTIFADTGDSTVVYRADPTLYISKKIAEAVSALS